VAAHEVSVLLLARHSQLPFTNNQAEQDLRMAKLKKGFGLFSI